MSLQPSNGDSCLSCKKPFPVQRELATIPNGKLIAFDPSTTRVWQVCAECHYWSLLGAEAARAAIPELNLRFDALPSAGPEGIARAVVSPRLELFRIGGAAADTATKSELAKARKELLSTAGKGISFLAVAFAAWQGYSTYTVWDGWGWNAIGAIILGTGIAGLIAARWGVVKIPHDRWLGPAMGIVGVGLALAGIIQLWWIVGAVAGGTLLGIVMARRSRWVETVVWTPGNDDVAYDDGTHWTIPLREWPFTVEPDRPPVDSVVAAFVRFESFSSLRAVIEHLCVEYGVEEGVLPLEGVSIEDRLLLGIAARAAAAEPRTELRDGVGEAQQVAAIAESLVPHSPRR